MRNVISRFTIVCTTVALLFGCGSGSSVAPPQQQKTATVTFSATNAPITPAVDGLQITALMPTGANVRLKAGTTNEIDPASLTPRLANSAVSGSYSSVNSEITLLVTSTSSLPTDWGTTGNIGPFAEIQVDCQLNVTPADFYTINLTFPGFKASNGTINNPTSLLTPAMAVTGI